MVVYHCGFGIQPRALGISGNNGIVRDIIFFISSKEVEMALKRLLLGICVLSVWFADVAFAQLQTTTANQDGILIIDALGRSFSAPLNENNLGPILFDELKTTSQRFGFVTPIVKDIELVGDPNGSAKGAYVLDMFGGQFALNVMEYVSMPDSPRIPEPRPDGIGAFAEFEDFKIMPYWGFDVAEDLEIAPDWRDVTFGYRGYFVLDADGVVHPFGETNLPKYVLFPRDKAGSSDINDATFIPTLFPETIDISGSEVTVERLLNGGYIRYPVNQPYVENQYLASNQISSVTPIYTYFGFGSDIARDLEISADYVTVTMPNPSDSSIMDIRTIAMTNGYYIMDGLGAVHSCRLPLDFDVNNDGQVTYEDMLDENGGWNPLFGEPINNTVISPPWIEEKEDLPYFGGDFAVDVEITPSGRGFFLLDVYGGVHKMGDAKTIFPPTAENGVFQLSPSTTPFFGIPIARDLAIVPNSANPALGVEENTVPVGFVVLDGFGTVHTAGIAKHYSVSDRGNGGSPVFLNSDTFGSVEVTPIVLPDAPPIEYFVVGAQDIPASIAPGFRDVDIDFEVATGPVVTGPVTGPN